MIEETVYYIGKNAKENDELFKTMPNDSTWFHLENNPSAHVYCLSKNKKINKKEIKKSAQYVRQYSKGQGSVIYTKKNNLKRQGIGLLEIIDNKFKKA